MSNTNLNDVAYDLIGVISIWNLAHMYYNTVQFERNPLLKYSNAHLGYLILGGVAFGTAITKMLKY